MGNIASVPGVDNKYPKQDEIERVILRRLHEGRIDGYTLEMAHEIAALVTADGAQPAVKTEAAAAERERIAQWFLSQYRQAEGEALRATFIVPDVPEGFLQAWHEANDIADAIRISHLPFPS